jgi:hypothetical protein
LISARLLLQQFVFRRREFLQLSALTLGHATEKIAPSLEAPAPGMKIVFATRVLYPAFYPPAKFFASVWGNLGAAIQRF